MSDTNNINSGSGKKSDDPLAAFFGLAILALAIYGGVRLFKEKPAPRTLSDIREDDFLKDLYGEDFLK